MNLAEAAHQFKDLVNWQGVLWQIAHFSGASFLLLALNMVLAREWGPTHFGDFTFLYTLIGVIGIMADFGLDMVLTRHTAQSGPPIPRAFWIVKGGVLALVGLVSVLTGWLLEARLRPPFAFLGIGVFLQSCTMFLNGALRGLERLDVEARIGLLQKALFVAGGILVTAAWKHDMVYVCAVYAVSNLLGFLLTLFLFRAICFPRCHSPGNLNPFELAVESWPVLVVGLTMFLCLRVDVFLIQWLGGTDTLGVYAAPFRVIEGLSYVSMAYLAALFPRLAVTDTPSSLKKLVVSSAWVLGLSGAFASAFLWPTAPFLMQGMLGHDYSPSVFALRLMGMALPAVFLGNLFGYALVAHKRQRTFAAAVFFGTALSIAVDSGMIPRYGVLGAVYGMYARAAGVLLITGLSVMQLIRMERIRP